LSGRPLDPPRAKINANTRFELLIIISF
jgi:hypothetical protein